VWGLATGREGLRGDTTAHALKIDYPNDRWDARIWYKRIGRDFDPSLGFVPRRNVQLYNPSLFNRTRLMSGPIQEMSHGVNAYIGTDMARRWETYNVQIQPLNWRFRSGDRVQVTIAPTGDRLVAPFAVSPGVVVRPGPYTWTRRTLSVTTAQKRRFYTSLSWGSGRFYDGDLDQFDGSWVWNPTPLLTVEFNGEHNVGRVSHRTFTQNLVGTRWRINVSPDLSIASYAQYDTDSDSVGINSRPCPAWAWIRRNR
jgi:hypothetical protein